VAYSLRSESRGTSEKSNCWIGLVYTLNLVKDWVTSKPNNGECIRVGEDPIVGGEDFL
jgi:hypothetical protein